MDSVQDLEKNNSLQKNSKAIKSLSSVTKIRKEGQTNTSSPALRLLINLNQILDDEKLAMEDSFSIEKDQQLSSFSIDLTADPLINVGESQDFSANSESFDSMTELTKDFQTCQVSKEAKRQAMRQFLDLKRLLDKEGNLITAGRIFSVLMIDSVLQKRLFSKISINISVLIRALKV